MDYQQLEGNVLARHKSARVKTALSCCISLLLIVIVIVGWLMISFNANHNHKEDSGLDHKTSLQCYECIYFQGWNWSHPPLPVENECERSPFNRRLCRKGEICHFGKLLAINRTRVQRSCYDPKTGIVEKQLGCVKEIGSVNSTYCYCDTNLC